jgi:DNA-binding NarL/FixJ family response regulator
MVDGKSQAETQYTFGELPLSPDRWQELVGLLNLPPQQARIVELILRNHCDKQIAAAMGIKVPTVRTYLRRTFDKLGVSDRLELVLKLFAASHTVRQGRHCHHS